MMVWTWIAKAIIHLIGSFKEAAAGIVARVLATFGLTTVTFNAILPNLKQTVMQYVGGLDGPAMQMLSYLGVGTVMSMVLSALTVRLTWKVFIVPKAVADQLGGGAS